jgi:hypothetical protein
VLARLRALRAELPHVDRLADDMVDQVERELARPQRIARRRRRAAGRMEALVPAQMQEARTPDDPVALTAGDRGAQVVMDALAARAVQPLERARAPPETLRSSSPS